MKKKKKITKEECLVFMGIGLWEMIIKTIVIATLMNGYCKGFTKGFILIRILIMSTMFTIGLALVIFGFIGLMKRMREKK